MKISEHLDLVEVTRSETAKRKGISNMPIEAHIENFKKLAENIFEPIRNHFNVPIHISSGYRSKELNTAIGGALSSDHSFGRAVDLDMDNSNNGVTNNDIFHWIKDNLKFKQLIAEYPENGLLSWVHIAYDENNMKNEILVCTRVNGKPHYVKYHGNEKLVK
jgi:zinc D-Ala-D-Ala carboxypeptidase